MDHPTSTRTHKDVGVLLKGPARCEDDATAPPVGAAELLSCPLLLLSLLFLDDGGRAFHLCPLLSAVLCRGTLRRPLLLLLLLFVRLLLGGFGHRCHVPGAEDNFRLGLLPLCFPPHPHRAVFPDPAGPVQEHAH